MPNKKIKNTTQLIVDDIKFKSKLEAYTYKKLKEANINVEYESRKYELLPAFVFNNKKVRPITYTPDFIGNNFIIECKGYPNDVFPFKLKLFYYYLYINNININYYIVHNQKEVDSLIKTLRNENTRSQ